MSIRQAKKELYSRLIAGVKAEILKALSPGKNRALGLIVRRLSLPRQSSGWGLP